MSIKPVVSLTEQALMRYPDCPGHPDWSKWRVYRIEYGNECSCPEGIVWLPKEADPKTFEDALNHMICGWKP